MAGTANQAVVASKTCSNGGIATGGTGSLVNSQDGQIIGGQVVADIDGTPAHLADRRLLELHQERPDQDLGGLRADGVDVRGRDGAGSGSILPGVLGAILTAMVTPFDSDLRVDEAASISLAHHLVEHGSDGLVIAGTTGEASTLTDEEEVALYRMAVREVGDRASVVAGTGSNDTAHSVHLTRLAAEAGVDAVLVVTPYYNRPPRAGIIGHVAAIAEVGLPVILYNIPGRSVVNLPPDLIAELGTIPNVVAVKQANPDLDECREVARTSDLALYAGNDDMLFPVLEMGGVGVISVASHLVGDEMAAVVAAAAEGDLDDARRRDAALADLYAALFVTTSPILIKSALEMIGLIPSARLRLPLVEATPVQRDILRSVLERQGILPRA